MSPPEVWGPAVWTLFHTLAEKINENAYPYVINSMFLIIVKICKLLPCPDCSKDASNFLAKIKIKDYKTNTDFKNMLYLFHNSVNAKKRKPLFNYSFINRYSNLNIGYVINNFIAKYNTKGNMNLLTESFQRGFVIKDFILWFKNYSGAFIQPLKEENIVQQINVNITQENITEQPITEQPITEQPITEQPITEQPITEQPITEQPITEEHFTEDSVNQTQEVIVQEEEKTLYEKPLVEEKQLIVEEEHLLYQEPVIEKYMTITSEYTYQKHVVDEVIKSKKTKKGKYKK